MEATHQHHDEHDHGHDEHDHTHDEHAHSHDAHEHEHAHDEHGHDHDGHGHDAHDHAHEAEHAVAAAPPHEDWNSDEYVEYWIGRQAEREPERHRQYVAIRALIPKTTDQEFRYVNLGAGAGHLDEVLLEQFHGASATLVDGSLAMLNAARKRLTRFGDRVEYVQANLANTAWTGAVSGPFDAVVATIAIHNLGDPRRIRALYSETFGLLGHGGIFLNLDYVRPAKAELAALAPWASKDPEAHFSGQTGGNWMPGTMVEQLGWLTEAGFTAVDAFWKDMNVVLFGALRDHLHLPEAAHDHDHDHDHGAEAHAHPH